MFPVNLQLEVANGPKKHRYIASKRLRYEYILKLMHPLNPDCVEAHGENTDTEQDEIELAQAAALLTQHCIPNFINDLDQLISLPIDSYSLTFAMHNEGINMRYLGEIALKTNLPHIKHICL